MAVDQLLAPLFDITLERQYKVQFEAIDPTTGAAVTGVKISNATITTVQAVQFDTTTPVPVAPLWIPLPLDAQ